jgi:ABC-2 type transport system ATP-binding protein
MKSIITVKDLEKTYKTGLNALNKINLSINQGEIFALLGPNGAGKTTLINTICGIVHPTHGSVTVGGYDIVKNYRLSRSLIGLVPQELALGAFESVWDTVSFSRGLFGKPKNDAIIENILKSLSLNDKRNATIKTLSGGMKRRVMIAKALSHEPSVLFLDEPTAGVDVELRKSMWALVRDLRTAGTTIILTTHYIEEAEEMADRIGIINKGSIILIEAKSTLMNKLGNKVLTLELKSPLAFLPETLSGYALKLSKEGTRLTYSFDVNQDQSVITELLNQLKTHQIRYSDLHTKQSSLEDIFVNLVRNP